jgi:tryptophan synthase beta chain
VAKIAPEMGSDQILVLNLSGRGDKDISIAAEAMGIGL